MAVLSSGDLERKQIRTFDNRGRKYYYHSLKSVNRAFQMGPNIKVKSKLNYRKIFNLSKIIALMSAMLKV